MWRECQQNKINWKTCEKVRGGEEVEISGGLSAKYFLKWEDMSCIWRIKCKEE